MKNSIKIHFYYFIFTFFCLLFFLSTNTYALQYTLESAVVRALAANPTIEEKAQILEQAKMNIGVSQSVFWPRASIVVNHNLLRNSGAASSIDELSSDTHAYGLRVTLSLFSGFSHLNRLQQAAIEKDIAELTKRQAELELTANVKIRYFLLLQSKRDLRLAKESIKRIQNQLKSSEAFSDEYMAPYVNVLQNKVELARGKEQLTIAQNNLTTCHIQLNQLLGHSPDESITYNGELEDFKFIPSMTKEEAINLSLKNRPDICIAKKSIEAAKKQEKATAGDFLPKIDLTYDNMSFSRDYRDSKYNDYDRKYWSLGVNLTWNFFEGGRSIYGTLSAEKRVSSLYASYKRAIETAKSEVLQSLMDIESAIKIFATAKEGIIAATEAYSQAKFRYEQGVGTITELLDSQTRLTEAEVRCSKAMADYQIAYAKFLYYIGSK